MKTKSPKDEIFKKEKAKESDFEFNETVTEVFDDMLLRSVPYYQEVQKMTSSLLLYYSEAGNMQNKIIYDLGCSTGSMLESLQSVFGSRPFHYIGIDNSEAMINKAKKRKIDKRNKAEFLLYDILEKKYPQSFAFISHYTIQFLRPLQRLPFLRKIYESLPAGGLFLMSEKVLENNSGYSRAFQKLYYDYKKENGYSSMEISSKRESLENVLIPYRSDENVSMLHEAGFDYVDLYFKWFNFASFIAIKKP